MERSDLITYGAILKNIKKKKIVPTIKIMLKGNARSLNKLMR